MKDFLTRSDLSNGSLNTKNLIDYAYRHNIEELGIVELEVIPDFIKSSIINVHYGVELLTSQMDLGLIVYNIKNIDEFKEKLNLIYSREQNNLYNEALKIFAGSSLFNSYLNNLNSLTIYHVVKMLIKLGYTSDLKSSLKILNQFIVSNKHNINDLINLFEKCGDLYIRVNDINFPKLNVIGVVYTGKKNKENLDVIMKKCEEYNYKLLYGSNFDNHKTGEIIGS